ncbi:hypothetical protein YL93_17590 [Salmonella enterica subsp. enterica serovar Montevideo]|nr:hypothetical protein [Salmonella enterica subsp. enterica serovar Montevideo]
MLLTPDTADKHKKAPSEIIVPGNTILPGAIPKKLEHLRGNLEAVFIKNALALEADGVEISKNSHVIAMPFT